MASNNNERKKECAARKSLDRDDMEKSSADMKWKENGFLHEFKNLIRKTHVQIIMVYDYCFICWRSAFFSGFK